jgi:Skp family chaperone for outer membrane proteins
MRAPGGAAGAEKNPELFNRIEHKEHKKRKDWELLAAKKRRRRKKGKGSRGDAEREPKKHGQQNSLLQRTQRAGAATKRRRGI